jgi:hypothetical protein
MLVSHSGDWACPRNNIMVCKTKQECPLCNLWFTANNIKRHVDKCQGPRKDSPFRGNRGGWNRGKTLTALVNDGHLDVISHDNMLRGATLGGRNSPGRSPDPLIEAARRSKLSAAASHRGLGGVRPSKRIIRNGKVLGSSFEAKVVDDLDLHGIKWDTCRKFPYVDPHGKHRTYTPDIYLIDYDVYLDPKNDFLIHNVNPSLGFKDTEKIELVEQQNDIKVLILNKNQLSWECIRNIILADESRYNTPWVRVPPPAPN